MKVSNCTEDWNKMNPNEIGRFCSSCKTSVHDIHDKSLTEIHELKSENEDKICGRISKVQFEQFRFLHPMKRFAVALFLVFGTGLFNTSFGQIEELENLQEVPNAVTSIIFSAQNKSGEPLSNVDISFTVKGEFHQGKTDSIGKLNLYFNADSKVRLIGFNIYLNDTFAYVEKEIRSGVNRLENIIYDPKTGEITIGEQVFYEEFLMGDVIEEDWDN